MFATPVVRVIDCHVARRTENGWEYLVLLRAVDHLDSGHWRVVTGKIESNETAWGAALRELTEETGFRNASLFAVPYVNQFYEWQHDRINAIPVFVAVVEHGAKPTLNEEHIDSRWIDVDQAVSILSWPGQREGLRAAHAMLSGYHPEIDTLEIRK